VLPAIEADVRSAETIAAGPDPAATSVPEEPCHV